MAGALDYLATRRRRREGQDRHDRPQPRRLDARSVRCRSSYGLAAARPRPPVSPIIPRCNAAVRHATSPSPLLILAGDKDDWTPDERLPEAAGGGLRATRAGRGRLLSQRLSQLRFSGCPTAPCTGAAARATVSPTIPRLRPMPRRAPRRSSRSISIDRDLGRLGELAPLRDLLGDLGAELVRSVADRLDAVLVEARLDLGQGDEAAARPPPACGPRRRASRPAPRCPSTDSLRSPAAARSWSARREAASGAGRW